MTPVPSRWTLTYIGAGDYLTTEPGDDAPDEIAVMPVSEYEAERDATLTRLNEVNVKRQQEEVRAILAERDLAALRVIVHGHVQVIRGMCTDMLDHREIDRALVRLDDAINPPEEGS